MGGMFIQRYSDEHIKSSKIDDVTKHGKYLILQVLGIAGKMHVVVPVSPSAHEVSCPNRDSRVDGFSIWASFTGHECKATTDCVSSQSLSGQ